jgi:hypothetical protein
LIDGPELPCNDASLPLRIKRHSEDGPTLIAKKLENRHGPLRDLVTSAKRFNDDVGYGITFWALASHVVSKAQQRFRWVRSRGYASFGQIATVAAPLA